MRRAFANSHFKVLEYLEDVDEGRIATRDIWTGTHVGPFLGVPASGRQIQITTMAYVFRFLCSSISVTPRWLKQLLYYRFSQMKGGKIIGSHMIFDKLDMLKQLGVDVESILAK
jgi:predicted ester cyclase